MRAGYFSLIILVLVLVLVDINVHTVTRKSTFSVVVSHRTLDVVVVTVNFINRKLLDLTSTCPPRCVYIIFIQTLEKYM